MRRNVQSLLVLLGKVSHLKASRKLFPKGPLLKVDVWSYTTRHVRVLTISDKEMLSYAKQCGSYSFMLIKEIF
jgi:hypothetical protein